MGVGFIQLITPGYEYNILNKEPQITFFKIYYRRHSNFFINNYEIGGNYLKDNSLLSFNIPKSGDFLSKSYLKIGYEENYTELLKQYPSLYCTLFNNILNQYDSYSIKINFFNENLIKIVSISKVNFIYDKINYLTIMNTYFKIESNAAEVFKYTQNCVLETDKNNIFYNINQYYNFYGYNMYSNEPITSSSLVLYLFDQIDFDNLNYIRIDFENFKSSFRIKFLEEDQEKYLELFNLIITNYNFTIISKIKIDKNTLYISLYYNNFNDLNTFYNQFIVFLFDSVKIINLEIIDNKIKSKKYTITEDVFKKIVKIVSNIDKNYITYYDIINNVESTQMILFILKDTPFFGNLTNNDFNEYLISNETQIISVSNLYSTNLPTDLYIRLVITLICDNNISIQEFLKIINNKDFNFLKKIDSLGQGIFNNKILDILINPNVLILSTNLFKKILYQNNVKNNFVLKNTTIPFTNRQISVYQSIVISAYLYYNVLDKFTSRYNQAYNSFDALLAQLVNFTKNNFTEDNFSIVRKSYVTNYIYNNNLFNFVINVNNDLLEINSLTNKNLIYIQNLFQNSLLLIITESINIIGNIYIKNSFDIYQPNGILTNLFYNMNYATALFPYSSNIFMYSEFLVDPCPTLDVSILKSVTIFNKSKDIFYSNLIKNIKNNIDFDFNLFKCNFNNTLDIDQYINDYLNINNFNNVIDDYYNNVVNDENKYNNELIKNYLYELTEINFNLLLPNINIPFSINTFIMENLFKYTDNYLYNNSFSNFKYYKKIYDPITKECLYIKTNFNEPNIFLNFIFIINSPIYRIYFLYTYFARMCLDIAFINKIPEDFITLRNLTFKFIISFIKFFNNINNSIVDEIDKINLDVSPILNNKINLINNFLCFDQINLFSDSYFNYLLSINPNDLSKSLIFLYQSFYFKKNAYSESKDVFVDKFNLDKINNFINDFRYNYDDFMIIEFLKIMELNKLKFINYDLIYNLVNNFFKKENLQYEIILEDIKKVFLSEEINVNIENLYTNKFYYNCYYSIFAVGTIFDNINLDNLNTINNTFNLTIVYNNFNQINNFYSNKSNDIKQFVNYLDNSNITDVFQYIYSQYNNLLLSYNIIAYKYYLEIVNNINVYIFQNFTYLLYCGINKIIFNQCLNIIINQIVIFNETNNTNINLIDSKYYFVNTSFTKTNIICILLLYMSFIYNCLSSDVNTFINSSDFSVDNNFDVYVTKKYSTNIYTKSINEIIIILSNSGILINLDYNTIYIEKTLSNKNNIINYQQNYLKYMQSTDIKITESNNKILFDLLNKFSFINVLNNNYSISSFSTFFNKFNNNLNNFIYQYNKILYSILNGGIDNKTISINNLTETSLQEEYIDVLNILYNETIYNIEYNIYNNLKIAYSTVNIYNNFKARIINNLLNTVKYFYEENQSNYFYTIFFNKCGILEKENKLNNLILNVNNDNPLLTTDNLVQLICNYININILYSIYFEKNLNRILYIFATNYAISKSKNSLQTTNYFKTQTLYDIVKIYESKQTVEKTFYKDYRPNTALYEDIDVFQIFNYPNWSDFNAFLQNKWINVMISKLDVDYNKTNSFYYYYNTFRKYCVKNFEEILLFKLDNNIPVIDYFNDVANLNELHQLIFNITVLSEDFAPNDIYNSIVELKKNNQAECFISILIDNIKKKIIIYLYYNYLVLSLIHILLIEHFYINPETKFEYDVETELIDFGIEDILSISNLKIIYFYISSVYSFDDDNVNQIKIDIDSSLSYYNDIIYIVNLVKNTVNINEYFITLVKKYIKSYELIIGNDDIYTTTLVEPIKGVTISNLIKRINIAYNNDITTNNPTKYELTIESIKLLDIKISNTIYDLNNIYYNSTYPESQFINNNLKNYKETDISNINIYFNLACSLLKYYNISYENLNNDVNNVIGNLRLGARFVNDILEGFKGLTSNYQLSYNLANYNDQINEKYVYENVLTRFFNIDSLENIAYNLDKLSIITPSDYDLSINNINFKKIYLQLFKKYYNFEYNYYNFEKNYVVIYERLFDYYKIILDNPESIIKIKENNIEVYKQIFYQIINTILSKNLYSLNTKNPLEYIDNYSYILKLFKQFNFQFQINKFNVSNTKNLILQNYFFKNNTFTNYEELYDYLINLYYYILLYDTVEIDPTKSNFDLVIFFNTINKFKNFNLEYKLNLINFIYRIKISIQLIIKIIEYKLSVTLNYNETILNKILDKTIILFTNKNIINEFFYTLNVKYQSLLINIYNPYKIFVNIVDYNKFVELFSKSIEEIIYYMNNYSIEYNLELIWKKYWENIIFKYYDFANNDFELKDFIFNFDNFSSIIFQYLDFLNQDVVDKLLNKYVDLYANYFLYLFRVFQNNTYDDIDFKTIYQLIFEQELDYVGTRIEESIYFTNKLFYVLKNTLWSILYFNSFDNKLNNFLDTQIMFYSFYFSYISFVNLDLNISFEGGNYDYNTFINNIPKLQILYRIMSTTIINRYINIEDYYNIFDSILLSCNTFVYFGKLIKTLDISSSPATLLDFINKNFIKKNIINNFYKTIQDETIKDIIKYKINTFIEQENNLDDFSIQIYNNYTNELQIFEENAISTTIINNTIAGLINNYSSQVNKFYSTSNKPILYTTTIINNILQNIKNNLDTFKNILGGYSNKFDNIYLSTTNIITLFNGKSFVFDENIITIFTLIYNLESLNNNDLIIILFYYNCYLTWLSTYGNKYTNNLDNIIYTFANLINTNIIKYTEFISSTDTNLKDDYEFIQINKFFDGLNTILFNVYDNFNFILICQQFFTNLVINNLNIDENIINDSVLFNIKTFNGQTSVNTPNNIKLLNSYFNSKETNFYIKNNKTNVWKYLLGVCVDFNECEVIKQMKSIYEFNSLINITSDYMNYIKEINGGYINALGIIKIFEYFKLYFDDQQIDFLNKQMYIIFFNLSLNLNIYPAIVEMLGINNLGENESYLTTGLTNWIVHMGNKNFYIPLNFFFQSISNAIPLIACMYTNIKIDALFTSKNIFKDSIVINYLIPFNVNTALNMDFIFVERDERKIICEKPIDNLIETHGNYIKTLDFVDYFVNPFDDTITLQFDFDINNLVKEIIWDLTFFLNYNKITPNNYKKINEKSYNIYDFILNTKFYLDGARRDGINNLSSNNYNGITTILNHYRYNTRAQANTNLNVYSFALKPEEFQPTGAINLNTTRIFSIQITMDKKGLLNYFGNTKTLFDLGKFSAQINLTTVQYNILRYQSGLSGLLFISNT